MHTDDDIFESLDIDESGSPAEDDIFEDLDMEEKLFSSAMSDSAGEGRGASFGAGRGRGSDNGGGTGAQAGRTEDGSRRSTGKTGARHGSPRELNTVDSSVDSRKVTREKAQKKKSRIRKIILWTILEAITLCAIFVYGYVLRNWNLIARPEVKLEAIENHNISLDKKKEMEGYWTIAVFGVDGRDSQVVGRGLNSDVILIANINKDNGEIRLVSVFRDTYLNISDNNSYNKINQAYAIGGPEQALAALNKNLDLNIQNYVTFNWKAVADGINILGGVDNIPISNAELYYINAYITETVKATGIGSVQLTHTGEQHLDGIQAVAYGRLRYMDNDFARTERQRNIIKACFEKAKKANFSVLNNIMVVCFPQVATNIGFNDIIAMAQNIADYNIVETGGFPWARGDAIIGKKGDCVVPTTLESNVKKLHEFLFGDTDYTPSDAVLRYSQKIKEDSNLYREGKFIESVSTDGGVIQRPRAAAGTGSGSSGGSAGNDDEGEEVTLGVDEDGNYIYPTDEDGNIVIPTDEDGRILYPTDEDGNIIRESAIRPTDLADESDGALTPGGSLGESETDDTTYGPGGGTRPAADPNTNPTRETTNTGSNPGEPVISPAGGTSPGSAGTSSGGLTPGSTDGSETAVTPGSTNSSTGTGGIISSDGPGSISTASGSAGTSTSGPGSSTVTPDTSDSTATTPGGTSSTDTSPAGAGTSAGPGSSSAGSSTGSAGAPGDTASGPAGSTATDSASTAAGPGGGTSSAAPAAVDTGSTPAPGSLTDGPSADGPG